jgi:hypothetical protein
MINSSMNIGSIMYEIYGEGNGVMKNKTGHIVLQTPEEK